MVQANGELNDLIELVARLRSDDGCPWDREQVLADVMGFLTEELEEVKEAAAMQDPKELQSELGDLLFNVVFAVHLAREKGWFDMKDVIEGVTQKLVRRHPHVFGNEKAETVDDVMKIWNRVKQEEKRSS